MAQEQRVKKPIWKRWWVWLIVGLLVIAMIGGGNGNDEEAADETEEAIEELEEEPEQELAETTTYEGSLKLAGKAIIDVEGSTITLDTSIDPNEYTDIVIKQGAKDLEGNDITPGLYEFQFIEFPEDNGGSWYIYITKGDQEIKVSGNPKASDVGEEYELQEGDIISVNNVSIATFYKIAE